MADKRMLTPNGSPSIRIVPANDVNSHHRNGGNGQIVQTISTQQQPVNGGTGDKKVIVSMEPPDGGARAWCVMVAAFLCNSIIFGIINVYGPTYKKLFDNLYESGDLEASSKASLVGSLTLGTTFFLSPVSGILTDKIGLRLTTFIGGILTVSGMLLSSIVYTNINLLYLTYGIMFGMGSALVYTPTLAILGHYFKRYLGIVSGFVTCGSSIFTIILPKLLTLSLDMYGLHGTFFILGSFTMIVLVAALIYKPRLPPALPPKRKPGQSSCSQQMSTLINVDNWKRRRYVVWVLSMPICLLGYFVPYVHMVKYVTETYKGERDGDFPIMCIGLTSGLGRLFFGYIADFKWVNRIILQQLAFAIMGILTIAIPLIESYPVLIAIALGMGIVDGCFISLLGPVAYDLCGAKGATQGIGFLLGLCSIPITAGAPIAGLLYDETHSYRWSFIMAGIPALIGSVLMTLIHFWRDERVDACEKQGEDQIHKLLNKPAWTDDITKDINTKNCNTYTFQKVNVQEAANGHIHQATATECHIDDIESRL